MKEDNYFKIGTFTKWEKDPTVDEAQEASDVLDLLGLCKELDNKQRMEVLQAMIFYGRAVHDFTLITAKEN